MFSERLKSSRQEMGLTLEQLAEKYNKKFNGGLNKGTLSKYENNKQEPMSSVVSNLATILNVSADYLLGGEKMWEIAKPSEELLEKAEQIFKLVDGMTYTEWCSITHIINRKYSSLQSEIEFTDSDKCFESLKHNFST